MGEDIEKHENASPSRSLNGEVIVVSNEVGEARKLKAR